jgi:hypothetical protein
LDNVPSSCAPRLFGTLGIAERALPPADVDILGGSYILLWGIEAVGFGRYGIDAGRALFRGAIGRRRHRPVPLGVRYIFLTLQGV